MVQRRSYGQMVQFLSLFLQAKHALLAHAGMFRVLDFRSFL